MDISHTLVSNSTQLDNVDLMGGPRDFTITAVKVTDSDPDRQVMSISLAEYDRPWKPGVTMRRLMAHLYGTDDDNWIGKRVRLYRDDSVKMGRDKPGGTRISHASDISSATTVTLPISKGKFGEFTVKPLPDAAPVEQPTLTDRVARVLAWFDSKGITQNQVEAHVGLPMAEWTAEHLAELNGSRDEIVAEGSEGSA